MAQVWPVIPALKMRQNVSFNYKGSSSLARAMRPCLTKPINKEFTSYKQELPKMENCESARTAENRLPKKEFCVINL